MKPRQQVSRTALDLIERFEGYRRTAAQLDDGRWTIGYGHTKTARQGAEVSQADAEALLIYDLMDIAAALNDWVYTPLTQNQFDALAAFAFNIGLENFRQSSVLRRVNEGSLLQAACAMEMWRRADFEGERIVIDALVRRRAAEKVLFLTPTDGFLPAPTPVLRPRLDSEQGGGVPAQRPVEVSTPMEGARAVAERIGPMAAYRPLTPMQEEEAPTASEIASDAVTARLQSILSDDEQPVPEPAPSAIEPVEASAPAEAEPSVFELTPLPPEADQAQTESEDAPAEARPAAEDQATAPLFPSEPMTFDDFDSQRVAHHEFDVTSDLDEVPLEPIRGLNPVVAWFGLIVLGIIAFVAGLFWVLNARPPASGGLFSLPVLVGGGMSIFGIGCVATAVYFLLERLGGREEQ